MDLGKGVTIPFLRKLKNETGLQESVAFYVNQQLEWAWRRSCYADSGSFYLNEPSWSLVTNSILQVVDAFYASLQIRCTAHNLRIAGFTKYKITYQKGPTFSFTVYCCTHWGGWRSQRQSEKVNIRNAFFLPLGGKMRAFLRSRKHWLFRQELMARDFGTDQGLKSADILCVFQRFQTAELGQKIRQQPPTIWSVIP